MWLQVCTEYNTVREENKELKKSQNVLLAHLEAKDQRIKELEVSRIEYRLCNIL